MGYDNRCTICRGVGSRFSGGIWDRCSVCEGRGYIQPVSTFTFIKMLYYLAGLIAICGLCGYCALGRGERWWGPHADSTPGAVAPPAGHDYVTVAPERFQRRYDDLAAARRASDIDRVVSMIDQSVFVIWTREQCAASLRRDLSQEFPDEGKVTTVHRQEPYVFHITDRDSGKTYETGMDHAYELTVDLPSGEHTYVTLGEAGGALTLFTPCG